MQKLPYRKDFVLEGYPRAMCHKCGKRFWVNTEVEKTWSCIYCGNLLYFMYGAFKQQIDMVMESARGEEYVKSPDGKTISPKTEDTLRRIRFAKTQKAIGA